MCAANRTGGALCGDEGPDPRRGFLAKRASRPPPSRAPSHAQAPEWRVMDAGCGTGLSGLVFRNLSQHLLGVDVSRRMVQKAQARAVYDELVVGDMAEELLSRQGTLDLVGREGGREGGRAGGRGPRGERGRGGRGSRVWRRPG